MSWGLQPDDFWEQVPDTYNTILTGRQKASQFKMDEIITGAWFAEMMAREKRLKPPARYIAMTKPKKPQTGADVLAIFQNFKAAGVPVDIKKLN